MTFKWEIFDVDENETVSGQKGGEVGLEETTTVVGCGWVLDEPDDAQQLEKVSGGEVEDFGKQNNADHSYSVVKDRAIMRFVIVSGYTVGLLCILILVGSSAYRGTLAAENVIALVSTFIAGLGMNKFIASTSAKNDDRAGKDPVSGEKQAAQDKKELRHDNGKS